MKEPHENDPRRMGREVDAAVAEFQRNVRRRIIAWGIRWSIGGVIVVVIVFNNPDLWWFAVVAALVAFGSLAAIYFTAVAVKKKHERMRQKLDELEKLQGQDAESGRTDRDVDAER